MRTCLRYDPAFPMPETMEIKTNGEIRTVPLQPAGKGILLIDHPADDDLLLKQNLWQEAPALEVFFSTDGIFNNVFEFQRLPFAFSTSLNEKDGIDLFSAEHMQIDFVLLKWWRAAVWVQLACGILLLAFICLILFLSMPSWRLPVTLLCLTASLLLAGMTVWKKQRFEKKIATKKRLP